jgi:hypothetical protein
MVVSDSDRPWGEKTREVRHGTPTWTPEWATWETERWHIEMNSGLPGQGYRATCESLQSWES